MYQRILLNLAMIPTLASSMLPLLLMETSAIAASTIDLANCDLPLNELQGSLIGHSNLGNLERLIASTELGGLYLGPTFTTAESDAAVALFGCDCSACIRALQQLRSPSLLNNGEGHCWSALTERVSQADIQNVLQTLEVYDEQQGL